MACLCLGFGAGESTFAHAADDVGDADGERVSNHRCDPRIRSVADAHVRVGPAGHKVNAHLAPAVCVLRYRQQLACGEVIRQVMKQCHDYVLLIVS